MTLAPKTPDHEQRDAHLLAALRHAPDHAVAPPPALSAQILAQARQAVRPAAGTVPVRGWAAVLGRLREWDRLLTRPAMAGALATVAVATVVGVMWRSGAPTQDEEALVVAAVDPAAAPAARGALPAEAASAQAGAGPTAEPARAPDAVAGPGTARGTAAAAGTAPGAVAKAQRAEPLPVAPEGAARRAPAMTGAAAERLARSSQAGGTGAAPQPVPPHTAGAPARPQLPQQEAAKAAAGLPPVPSAPPPAAAPAVVSDAAPTGPAADAATEPLERRSLTAPADAPVPGPAERATQSRERAAFGAAGAPQAAPPPVPAVAADLQSADPLAALLSTARQRPGALRLVPSLPGAESRRAAGLPATPAPAADTSVSRVRAGALDWLDEVGRAAHGRWYRATSQLPQPPQDGAQDTDRTVLIDGVPQGRLVLSGGSLWWWPQALPQQAWRADVGEATVRALRASAPAGSP